ncbi:TetR/AcrR family transcriptional regulator [Conexibacter woesei]|uniref:Transcriptional regulator, TetR family n=1 Tax=Conexibacter woesei (strain DSM 14684 / CCUG 47730 / CIP 108061 / JCM 11494 / NBRC 100937 / ID131577) TaxID=469383 RepID=D3F6P6_CONWI|nr:TetR/AcrR family transcriptional regulator [Conexibacter woesei]ADB52694.1 transcriptional regulator, TetR family [Conexibacter woesei DSM 14684]
MSRTRPSSRLERAARTRRAIVVATAEAVAERGVRGMRVEDVAARAGVSTSLLYYHFDDRLTLLRAALDHANAQAPSGLLRVPHAGTTEFEAVRNALLRELDTVPQIRNNSIVWNEISATAVFEPELREDLRRVTAEWNGWVAEAIAAGVAEGSIRAGLDPADTAELLTSVVEGLSLRWLAGSLELERARVLCRDAIDAILSPA